MIPIGANDDDDGDLSSHEYIDASCTHCNQDFRIRSLRGSADPIIKKLKLTGAGYCPLHIRLCRLCFKNDYDASNDHMVCAKCFEGSECDDRSDEDEENCEIGVDIDDELSGSEGVPSEVESLGEYETILEAAEEVEAGGVGDFFRHRIENNESKDYITGNVLRDQNDCAESIVSVVDPKENETVHEKEVVEEVEEEAEVDDKDEEEVMALNNGGGEGDSSGMYAHMHNPSPVLNNVCQALCSAFMHSSGSLEANGDGGSTNGEPIDKSCKIIAEGLKIGADDVLLDIGSGGGLTIARLQAISNCKIAVGVEVESIRHSIAVNFNLHLMENFKNQDFRVAFLNEDIRVFRTLNGFTRVYMFDKVFTSQLMMEIASIFNESKTVQYLASSQNMQNMIKFNFNVELMGESEGSLLARGGNMSHKFYFYLSKSYDPAFISYSPNFVEPKFHESFNIARERHLRLDDAMNQVNAFHKSARGLRESQVRKILNEPSLATDNESSVISAKKLFDILNNEKGPSIINGVMLIPSLPSRSCIKYNERALSEMGKSEMDAISLRQSKKAYFVPSFDGKEDGKILVGLVHDQTLTGNVPSYVGVVYNISTQKLERKSLQEWGDIFDYENSMPFDIENIFSVFFRYGKISVSQCIINRLIIIISFLISGVSELLSSSKFVGECGNRIRQ